MVRFPCGLPGTGGALEGQGADGADGTAPGRPPVQGAGQGGAHEV